MDPTTLDRLTRLVSAARSRRSLGGLGIGLLSAVLGVQAVDAAPCPTGTKRCGKRCIPKSRCCTNANCQPKTTGRVCRRGHCVCPQGRKRCRGRCIPRVQCCQAGDCVPSQTCTTGRCVNRACGAGGPCLAFISSEPQSANLGGITGGNGICQRLATAAGLPGTYRAWLSDDEQSPSTSFVQSTGPYVRVDGTVLAANWAGLTSGQLQAPLEVTEQGTTSTTPDRLVWTGTNPDGTWVDDGVAGDPAFADCDGWTRTDAMAGAYGQRDLTSSGWTSGGALNCSLTPLPIYCFQQS